MNTKQFKKLLKESIKSNGSNILNQVQEMDYTDGDAVLGGHYEEPEEETQEEPEEEPEAEPTWQDRYKDALVIAKRWYDKINTMPINNEEDLKRSINTLFSSKKQIVAEGMVPSDGGNEWISHRFDTGKLKNYQTVKDVFKSKDIQVAEPGPEGLGLPRFEAFVKVFADWDKNKIENGRDFQKVLLKYGPKVDPKAKSLSFTPGEPSAVDTGKHPSAATSASSLRRRARGSRGKSDPRAGKDRVNMRPPNRADRTEVPNSFMRYQKLPAINEEEDGYSERYMNTLLRNLSEKELAKVVIKYIKALANNKLAQSIGMSSGEELDDFSEKNIAGLAAKLDDAKKEIEEASTELTSNNLMTLVRYSVFGKFLEKPETIRQIHGTFGNYIKMAVESYLNNEGANIELFRDGVLEILKNSPLYSSESPKIVNDLLKGKKVDSLIALDQLIDKKPHGFQGSQNTKTFSDIIAKAKGLEQALNESVYGGEIKEYLNSFLPFAKKRLNYDKEPKINFVSDPENGKIPLGKTAYYEPANMAVTVFTDNRHPKDIMRSLSHELVHHSQNCDGQFDSNKGVDEGYAQNDEHLRIMEEDAYLRGNMCFRDWEDKYKQTNRAFGNALQENRERLYYELMRRFK